MAILIAILLLSLTNFQLSLAAPINQTIDQIKAQLSAYDTAILNNPSERCTRFVHYLAYAYALPISYGLVDPLEYTNILHSAFQVLDDEGRTHNYTWFENLLRCIINQSFVALQPETGLRVTENPRPGGITLNSQFIAGQNPIGGTNDGQNMLALMIDIAQARLQTIENRRRIRGKNKRPGPESSRG